MSGIQRIIVVFAIAFWGNAHSQIPCSVQHVEYKNAGDAVYKAFYDLIDITMNNSSLDKKPYMSNLKQSLNQFLDDSFKYCSPNQTITIENFTEYLKMVEFSISNVTVLTDLEKNGAFQCIRNQKANMDQCLTEHVNNNKTLQNNYSRLHAKSHLNFNDLACAKTKNVKTCVLKVIKDNKCDNAMDYVESLFDFLIKNCDDVNKTILNPNASVKITGHWIFLIMVSLWSFLI